MYCSIQEAWENNNTLESLSNTIKHNVSRQSDNFYTNEHFQNAEVLPNQSNLISDLNNESDFENTPIYSDDSDLFLPTETESEIETEEIGTRVDKHIISNKETITYQMCDSVFKYILSNIDYRNKLENKYRIRISSWLVHHDFLSKLLGGETKEIIIIILVSIFIILVLDIFVNLGKNLSFKK